MDLLKQEDPYRPSLPVKINLDVSLVSFDEKNSNKLNFRKANLFPLYERVAFVSSGTLQ